MDTLIQDLKFGMRTLWKTKTVTLIAMLALALGIGANTAMFSIIYSVLLKPLPFHQPDRLVQLFETEASPGEFPMSAADYLDWKRDNKTFQDMSLFSYPHSMNLSDNGEASQVTVYPTEANFFSVLGVQPLIGRMWSQGDDRGENRIVILSYPVWKTVFNADAGIVGKTVKLDGASFNVVGVMKQDFDFPTQAQLWIPQDMSPKTLGSRGNHGPHAIGRLKDGVTISQAQADLSTIAQRIAHDFPRTNADVRPIIHRLQDSLVGKSRDGLLMVFGAVVLVLLIACVNVANLLLARAVARQKEIAIRSALGAAKARLVRQMLTESVLLALFGAVAGVALAYGLLQLLSSMNATAVTSGRPIEIDTTVLLFTLGVSVFSGLLFGIAPALQIIRGGRYDELKGGAGKSLTANREKSRTTRILVVSEMALSVLLLISATLLLKDFAALRGSDVGVRTDHVWTASVQLPRTSYQTQPQQFAFEQNLLEKVRQIPGIKEASITDQLPLFGGNNGYVHLPGHETEGQSGPLVESHNVSPDYFQALDIPVLQGRGFNQQDLENEIRIDTQLTALYTAGGQPTPEQGKALLYRSVINKTMAEQFWPGQDPIGKTYTNGNESGPWHQVVGVVGDVRQWGLAIPAKPETYDVFDGQPQFRLLVHTSVEPGSITGAVRQAVASLDGGLALSRVRTMKDLIAESSASSEFLTTLLGGFAGLALLLAGIGVYGVLANSVLQRTQEIGIRISLGATRTSVIQLMMWSGVQLAVAALVIGTMGAFAARRVIAASLRATTPDDPRIYVVAPACMLLVAAIACYLPAMRASRIDPTLALRQE